MIKLCRRKNEVLIVESTSWQCPGNIFQNMTGSVVLGGEVALEIIGKEKKFENGKHDEQFYGDDFPQGSAYHHGAEAVSIKKIHLFWQCGHAYSPRRKQTILFLCCIWRAFARSIYFFAIGVVMAAAPGKEVRQQASSAARAAKSASFNVARSCRFALFQT